MLQKWDIQRPCRSGPDTAWTPGRVHGPGMRGIQRPRTMSASSRVRRRRRVRQAASAAGRVWAKRFGPGVRHRKRARRFGRGNRIRRCGAGRVRPHRVGAGLRRERLWFMHWRDGHASPSKDLVGSLLLTRVQDTPGAGEGTGSRRACEERRKASLSPGSERRPKCQSSSIY